MTNTAIAVVAGGAVSRASVPEMPKLETVAKHRAYLDSIVEYGVAFNEDLLPAEVANECHRELTEAIYHMATPEDYAARCVAVLINAFPQKGPASPDIYAATLIDELRSYPADIARDAVKRVYKTRKFFPAIAEVLEEASAMLKERKKLLRAVERVIDERERREREAAKKAASLAEQLQRNAQLQAGLEQALGALAPHPGDYDRAVSILRRGGDFEVNRWRQWEKDLKACQPWAAKLCRRLGIVGMANELAQGLGDERRLDCEQVLRSIDLARTDEAAARKSVDDAAGGALKRDELRPDNREDWAHIKERVASLIEESWSEYIHASRHDFECALSEMKLRGIKELEIQRFIGELMYGTPGAAERQAELAAANRARPASETGGANV